MRTVGIKQLKARLSEYVRAVRQGEVFLVTDRDAVVAELRPPGSHVTAAAVTSTSDILNAMVDSGEATAPEATRAGWRWKPDGLGLSEKAVSRIIEGVRADREPGD